MLRRAALLITWLAAVPAAAQPYPGDPSDPYPGDPSDPYPQDPYVPPVPGPPPMPPPAPGPTLPELITLIDGRPPVTDEVPTPYVFVAGHLGILAPLGIVGAEAGIGWSWGKATAGIGFGLQGVELAALIQVQLAESGWHLFVPSLGVGVSRGPGTHDLQVKLGEGPPERYVEFGAGTYWANGELDVERRITSRASLRAYLGVSVPFGVECVAEPDGAPDEPCTAAEREELESWMPYAGTAIVFRIW